MTLKIFSFFYGGCFLSMMATSYRLFFLQSTGLPFEDIQHQILGQFGALALSVIGLYVAGRFIQRLLDKNQKLQEEIKELQKERIMMLEAQLKNLKEK